MKPAGERQFPPEVEREILGLSQKALYAMFMFFAGAIQRGEEVGMDRQYLTDGLLETGKELISSAMALATDQPEPGVQQVVQPTVGEA